MPASVSPELQQLLGLIASSPRLTDEERDVLLTRVMAGDFPDDLLRDVQAFIQGEMAANEQSMREISADGTQLHASLQTEEVLSETQANAEVDRTEKQMEEVITGFQTESERIIRTSEKTQEARQQGTDAASAEALRNMLKGQA